MMDWAVGGFFVVAIVGWAVCRKQELDSVAVMQRWANRQQSDDDEFQAVINHAESKLTPLEQASHSGARRHSSPAAGPGDNDRA